MQSVEKPFSAEDAYKLFDQGKTAADLVELGVKRSSAYLWARRWRKTKGLDAASDTGQLHAKVFALLLQGKGAAEVVVESKLPYETVQDLMAKFEEAAGRALVSREKVKAVEDLATDSGAFLNRLGELEKKAKSIEEAYRRLDGITSYRVDLAVKAIEHQGDWKLNDCAYRREGLCSYWAWAKEPSGLYWLRFRQGSDGKWRVEPQASYCATCPGYSTRTP